MFGALADRKGARVSLSVSCTIIRMGAIMYAFIHPSDSRHMFLLLAAQVVLGVGSGTLGVTR
jgi:MFS family permease